MFRSDFRKKGVCSKSVTKTLYQNKVLASSVADVPSQIFDRILNTPLSYYDSICYYNIVGSTALSSSEIQVKY